MSEGQGTQEVPVEEVVRFEHYVRFVSRDPAKNRQRFYLLSWQVTLEGNTVLVCTWGRLGTPGRSRVIFFPVGAPDETRLQRLIERRLKRGYQVTEWR